MEVWVTKTEDNGVIAEGGANVSHEEYFHADDAGMKVSHVDNQLHIVSKLPKNVSIKTETLPVGRVGEEYSQTLTATATGAGHDDDYIKLKVLSGALPAGLEFKSPEETGFFSSEESEAIISGTPTKAGPFVFTIKAFNNIDSDKQTYSVEIAPLTVTVEPKEIVMEKGSTHQFSATVNDGINSSQDVTWEVADSDTGTDIGEDDGFLSVDENETAKTLTVRATSTFDKSVSDTAVVTMATYGISLKDGTHTFPSVKEGYGLQASRTVEVTNKGNWETGALNVELSNASDFKLSDLSIPSIAAGKSAAFAVTHEMGLAAGAYTATVTVSGGNDISADFIVSFTVVAASEACDVLNVEAPSGEGVVFDRENRIITATVASGVPSQRIIVTVSPYANWELYELYDEVKCINIIPNQTMILSDGDNTVYIKVTAEDGTTTKVYTVIVTKQTSGGEEPPSGGDNPPGGGDNPPGSGNKNLPAGSGGDTTAASAAAGSKTPNLPTTYTTTVTGIVIENIAATETGAATENNLSIENDSTSGPANILTCLITEDMAKNAVTKAKAEAKKRGKEADGIIAEFNITDKTAADHSTGVSVSAEEAALNVLAAANAELSIVSGIYKFRLDKKAAKSVAEQTEGIVAFSIMPPDELPDEVQSLFGSRPVYDFTVTGENGAAITDYGDGTILRGIKYDAQPGEEGGWIYAVGIQETLFDGDEATESEVTYQAEWIGQSSYHEGWVIWRGGGNSVYGVGYKTPDAYAAEGAPGLEDTITHQNIDAIGFAASRGYMAGTGETQFSPNAAITRGDFAMALGKLANADISGYKKVAFKDIKPDDPALPYIAWAAERGVIPGSANNQFKPGASITRDEMAGIWQAYAAAIGYTLPISHAAVKYADDNKVATKLRDAVAAVRQAGIMSGRENNRFDPKSAVTRAEAAMFIRRFAELRIDAFTTRGWVRNDSGRQQYIDSYGKALTDWKRIEGNRYFFDKNGYLQTWEQK
jgi:hypothetical protein